MKGSYALMAPHFRWLFSILNKGTIEASKDVFIYYVTYILNWLSAFQPENRCDGELIISEILIFSWGKKNQLWINLRDVRRFPFTGKEEEIVYFGAVRRMIEDGKFC